MAEVINNLGYPMPPLKGCPTVAIDRLGCGDSTHPTGTDLILVVQTPAEVKILHQIVLLAEGGGPFHLRVHSTRSFLLAIGELYGVESFTQSGQ